MRTSLLFSFALLAALCCSSPTKSDPRPGEEPQTRPTETPATAPATSAATAPTAEDLSSVVVFIRASGDQILPVVCYDGKSILKKSACLPLVPKGASVAFSGENTARVTGASNYECDIEGTEAALTVEGLPSGGAALTVGVWSKSANRSAAFLKPGGDLGSSALPEPGRSRLEEAVRAKAPSFEGILLIKQVVSADFDGDGEEDTLYSVAIPHKKPLDTIEYSFAALFYIDGQTPEGLRLLASSEEAFYLIDGYIDLDGDKSLEIWLSTDYYEESSREIVGIKDGKLESMGSWECGE